MLPLFLVFLGNTCVSLTFSTPWSYPEIQASHILTSYYNTNKILKLLIKITTWDWLKSRELYFSLLKWFLLKLNPEEVRTLYFSTWILLIIWFKNAGDELRKGQSKRKEVELDEMGRGRIKMASSSRASGRFGKRSSSRNFQETPLTDKPH